MWILFLLALIGGCVLSGALAGAWSGSKAAGVIAGILAATGVGMHTLTSFAMAVGEYEEYRTPYEELVRDHYVLLVLGSLVGPILVVVALHAVARAVATRAR